MEVGGHVACARSFNFSVNLTDHFDLFEVSFLSSLDRASSFQILDLDLSGMKGISPGTVNCWMAKNMLKHDGFLVNFATASGCEWWRADLRNQRRRGGPSNLWCVAWCGTRWLVGWWWTRELLTCQGWWWCYELSHRIILAVFNQLVRLGFSCWSWKMEWRWCIMVDVCRCYQQILLWDERYIVCHHHDCSHFVIKQGSNGDHSLLLPSWSVCNCWTWYPAVARASS